MRHFYFFEKDKSITVQIIQAVPISSGKPNDTFNHRTDKIVADKGSIQLSTLDSVGRRYLRLSK